MKLKPAYIITVLGKRELIIERFAISDFAIEFLEQYYQHIANQNNRRPNAQDK